MKKLILFLTVALSGYCSYAQYLPLSGGTLTGPLLVNDGYFSIQSSGSNIFASGSTAAVIGAGPTTDYINYIYGNNPFTIWTNNAKRMIVDGSGNVGIGTTSPGAVLDVKGNAHWGNSTGELSSDGNGAIELGPVSGNGNVPFIDWHYGTGSYQDYNVRLMNSGNNRFDIITASNGTVFSVNGSNVGIGTTDTKGYTLAVNGSTIATSMTVKLNANWPDYVFKPSYQLPSLTVVKAYIDKNQHLPDLPSEQEVKDNGINLGEIVKVQTKKIEELTLYLIDKDKQLSEQNAKLADQQKKNDAQEARIAALEKALLKQTENQSK